MSHHIVEISNLSFAYPDGTHALNGVSFRIEHGESVALVGANGAGKSTLLLHLNGCLLPTVGTVRVGDVIIAPETVKAARRAVGMVFQDPDDQLFMPTVADDVSFGPMNMSLPAHEIEERTRSALARVGMEHVSERPPYRLSAGEKRAVAIATVLSMEPDILVMDEPSSNLDPRSRRRLIELLKSFEHTKIVATHDLELVVEVCSRIILMDSGKIVADGPSHALLNDEPLMLSHGLERPHSLRHLHPHS